jgi:seryl-tRNA synthetase
MLPKREELNKLLKDAKTKKEKEAEERHLKALEAKVRKEKEQEEKLKEDIETQVKRIEESVLYAIREGKNEAGFRFGDGHTEEPVWERAVAKLKRNKDYTFKIQPISVHCDNYSEAANVDGVSARDWYEPMWELKVTW